MAIEQLAKRCPFCGQIPVKTKTGFHHEAEPFDGEPRCWLGGFHLGSERVKAWNNRWDE